MLKIVSAEIINMSAGSERIRLHSRYPMLVFVTCGSVFINKERMDSGVGCLVGSMENTYVRADKDIPCTIARFEIDGKDTESLLDSRALSETRAISKFVINDIPNLSSFARLICDTRNIRENEELCEASAKLLLSFTAADSDTQTSSLYNNRYVDSAVKYIDSNLAEELRVEQIANMLGIDRMYMRNLFVEHVGMSTMEYIMNARMERAKQLLENERMSVSEVATSVGYSDVLAFSKTFKKHIGVSPTEHRTGTKKQAVVQKKRSNDVPIFIL